MTKQSRYLTRRIGRDGWYFIRHVPEKLRGAIGCSCWRRKAGATLPEAKRNALVFLEETDQLLAQATGRPFPEESVIRSFLKKDLIGLSAVEVVEMVAPQLEVYDEAGSPNTRFEQLHSYAQEHLEGRSLPLKTQEDLLSLATLLKEPAGSTRCEWERHLAAFMAHCGKQYVSQVTREEALAYRQHQLNKVQASTAKTRLRFLSGLFNVALDEGWVKSNPFQDITKRVRSKVKVKEVMTLEEADQNWTKLPKHHQLLWHFLRWTCAHASEAGGLRWEDVDLEEGVISFKSHELRPLKNSYRIRAIPIHSRLLKILSDAKRQQSGLIFPWAYNHKRARWAEGMHWSEIIGVSPKATRDWAATCLRQKDINERVIGALFGHTPRTVTGVYGAVDLPTMRRALEQLA